MATVREINDPAELENLRCLWHSLLQQTPDGSFFHSLDWLLTYWRHFSEGQRLRVLVVSSEGRDIGILPLVVRQARRRLGRLRVLTYPLDDWGSFYGPIGPNPTATLLAGLNHVRRTRRDWDLIELPWIDEDGYDAGRTRVALRNAGLAASREPWTTSALVDLESHGSWDAYWASRTSHWRTNVRRSMKRLAEQGTVEYVRYRPAGAASGNSDTRLDLYNQCEQLAAASWQGSSTSGTTLSHEAIRAFLRDCHQAAAHAGALDMNLLLVDGKCVAFNYAYQQNGYVFGLRTGYLDQEQFAGAGTVLQARMIEDSFARGDRVYDLGPGYLECKKNWQTQLRASYRYSHFPSTAPAAQLVRAKRGLERMLRG